MFFCTCFAFSPLVCDFSILFLSFIHYIFASFFFSRDRKNKINKKRNKTRQGQRVIHISWERVDQISFPSFYSEGRGERKPKKFLEIVRMENFVP